jgi:hypothetical protein
MSAKKARQIGPRSRPHIFGKLDGRTKEALHLQAVRAELAAHVGGDPDAVQRMLIERLAIVSLRLALYDQKFTEGKPVTEHDSRVYASLHGHYQRMLRQLGPAAAAKPMTADEHIARLAAREAAERAERGVAA